ncbi:MAG: PAS domain S-box protein, partial [Bacteroidota bacterium]|nr:PAS domain S-box protein [Bacteroidota bacterium]
NQAFITHYGYNRDEVLRMSYDEITPPEDRPAKISWLFHSTQKDDRQNVKRHQKKSGEIIYVETKSHTINFQNKTATHVLINDITEQKKAEQALFELNEKLEERIHERTYELMNLNASLRETEIKFKTVTDFTYGWEYWKSPENKILFMSPSVERITGYTVSEFEENPALLDTIVHPTDRPLWDKYQKERCPNDPYEQKIELSFRIVTRNGDIRWLGHVCRCIHVDGKFLGVRVSNRDITESVITENRMLQITAEVEERERNRFSRELHDGMGPLLSAIKLYFQWLADSTDTDNRKLITEKGNHSIEMAIQTVRELARGISSQYITELGFVQAIIDFAQQINDTNKIQIIIDSNTHERFGVFHELMLFRIATELIKNTLTYAKATLVKIKFSIDQKKIVFIYTDNGVGFDWLKIQKEKKGLGLMNIQHRVRILQGNIDIESKCGEGMKTTIEFTKEER